MLRAAAEFSEQLVIGATGKRQVECDISRLPPCQLLGRVPKLELSADRGAACRHRCHTARLAQSSRCDGVLTKL